MFVSMIDGMGLHYCMFKFDPDFFAAQQRELEHLIRKTLSV